jgi:hypothetical protein
VPKPRAHGEDFINIKILLAILEQADATDWPGGPLSLTLRPNPERTGDESAMALFSRSVHRNILCLRTEFDR